RTGRQTEWAADKWRRTLLIGTAAPSAVSRAEGQREPIPIMDTPALGLAVPQLLLSERLRRPGRKRRRPRDSRAEMHRRVNLEAIGAAMRVDRRTTVNVCSKHFKYTAGHLMVLGCVILTTAVDQAAPAPDQRSSATPQEA